MKSLSVKAIAGLVAGAAVLSAGAVAIAQDGPGRPPVARPGPERGQRPHFDDAARKQRLHDLLQITPAQQGAFDAWQTAVKPPERPKDRLDFQAMERLSTPQRLDAQLARLDKRTADAHARADATRRFYGQLSPTQKTAFDSLPPMMGRHGPHGGRHGFGGGHRGGPGGPRHGGPGGEGLGPPRDFGGQ